jgi:hypothetical protein
LDDQRKGGRKNRIQPVKVMMMMMMMRKRRRRRLMTNILFYYLSFDFHTEVSSSET